MDKDIRWQQRFFNYQKALKKLTQAIEILQREKEDTMSEISLEVDRILQEGLILRFEYTHELACNVMKDFAEYQGNFSLKGSRDATREAFKMQLIEHPETWMDMIKARNDTSHTYNEETVEEIFKKITTDYYKEYIHFEKVMRGLTIENQDDIFDKE